jgi:hypothetical protein
MSPRCRKKIVCHDNTTQHQPNQNKRRREIYEQTKDYLNTKKWKWKQKTQKRAKRHPKQ